MSDSERIEELEKKVKELQSLKGQCDLVNEIKVNLVKLRDSQIRLENHDVKVENKPQKDSIFWFPESDRKWVVLIVCVTIIVAIYLLK